MQRTTRVVCSASASAFALIVACEQTPLPQRPIAPPQAPPPSSARPSAGPAAPAPPRADTSLTPRKTFFADPDHAAVSISPDGRRLGFLAATAPGPGGSSADGVLNLWVGSAEDPASAKPVTHEMKRGIRQWWWAFTSAHVLYRQDKDGDENWHVHAIDLATGADRDLTPIEGVNAEMGGLSPRDAKHAIVALNDRDKRYHDAYLVDIVTGDRKLLAQNDDGFVGFVTDDDMRVRYAVRQNKDGSADYLRPAPNLAPARAGDAKDKWKPFLHVPMEDALTTSAVDFDKTGKTLFLKDSRNRDTSALFAVDTASGKAKLLADNDRADVGDPLVHPTDKRVQAVPIVYDRQRWMILDRSLQPDFDSFASLGDGDVSVTSRSLDDKRWIVAIVRSDGPVRYFRYDRGVPGAPGKATFLFTNAKAIEAIKLAKTFPAIFKSRDGLDLVSYVTIPPASDPDGDSRPDKPLPMVLFVHGGPWARDMYGLNAYHQWLASRGYAVVSVNYRGSTGFGKKFVNAGNMEWAGKMHDDLLDAVEWAVREKIAEPTRVAIMGGSYGGYATLVGLTFTPGAFACGVDIVGPSNLVTLMETIPPYWQPEIETFAKRVGDFRTEEGKKFLLDRSPLMRVDAIKRPLLIGQGANDPRVKQAESDQIVAAMRAKNISVTYVLYADEGHGFARAPNRRSFNAVAETFLAQCLGGPYLPVGDDFDGSTIAVPAGAENVFGLQDALAKRR